MPIKISRMLHLLEFKLTLENQFKDGIDKMIRLYSVDGDKKMKHDAEAKRVDSQHKIALLNAALKHYKSLDVMDVEDDDGELSAQMSAKLAETDEARAANRRPQTGTLSVTIDSASGLNRPPTARRGRSKPESVVVMKVEGNARVRSGSSQRDRWQEHFEIQCDKANEIEVAIYDKAEKELPVPVGMLWLRLSDIVEELRKRKVIQETKGPGWVKAERVEGGSNSVASSALGPAGALDVPYSQQQASGLGSMSDAVATPDGIDAWFAVEPEGRIRLKLDFVKSNARKRPAEGAGGLGRQGAVRKRKQEVIEQSGHRFVSTQFYNIVLCAYCRQFFRDGSGMKCEDCEYAWCVRGQQVTILTPAVTKSATARS